MAPDVDNEHGFFARGNWSKKKESSLSILRAFYLIPDYGQVTFIFVIRNFTHEGLKRLYETGSQKGVQPDHTNRLRLILARLDASQSPQDMSLPGLNLHPSRDEFKGFWAVSVSGNWRVIFRFEDNNAVDVNYIDYH